MFEIVEEIRGVIAAEPLADGRPLPLPFAFHIVTLWSRDERDRPEAGRGRVRMELQDGASLMLTEYDIDLKAHQRLRVRTLLDFFPFSGSGVYHVVVETLDSESQQYVPHARLPIEVLVEKGPIGSAPAEQSGTPRNP